ncbi:hypothetical protein FRC04_007197 [Tulasnella sp. 424]|nr:hypothetical protein FRC04_007197 [Tulasnella sp. 424]KAG8974632.1 hypothetical protein FRC05_007109 [Tulasnella sp. 425]
MDTSTPSNVLRLGSTRDYQGPYIHQLPPEILIIIFHLCIDLWSSGKDITRLLLVCRAWKATVDNVPSLWTTINAADGLQHIRTAIAKTRESPIDLIRRSTDPVSLDDFLMEVGGKIAYWRSVELHFDSRPASYRGLQTSTCTRLEKLRMARATRRLAQKMPLCPLDGGPAPAMLKELSLFRILVDLRAMRLSNLSKLELNDVPHLVTEDILLVLDNSPMLVTLRLQKLGGLRVSDPIGGVTVHLGSLATCTLNLPIPVTRFLLSAMHTPSLRRMKIHCDLDGSTPASSLFSPPITTFAPTLPGLISPAKYIDVEFSGNGHSTIVFGGLEITLHTPNFDEYRRLRDMLNSLMSHPGVNGAGLNAHLHFSDSGPDLENLLLFNCQPMVEELIVSGWFWDDISSKISAGLGTRIHNGPEGWLFPELEVIKYYIDEDFYDSFEIALERRYCEVRTTEETSATTRQYPRSLKEIHFHSEDSKASGPEFKQDFLNRIRTLAGNPKIFWRGVLLDVDDVSP